jgi:hypothetical protein
VTIEVVPVDFMILKMEEGEYERQIMWIDRKIKGYRILACST